MKLIENKIIEKVLKEQLNNIKFPFLWGIETLIFINYYQKGEEELLLNSFYEIKRFQEWMDKNFLILNEFLTLLQEIRDFRNNLLIDERLNLEDKKILKIWGIIENFVIYNKIPLSKDLLILPNISLGLRNYIWEIISWYLKVIKFITFSINFDNFPHLNSHFYFEGHKIYKINKEYYLKDELSFISNLIINLSGFPSREGIKNFSLPQNIIIKNSIEDYFVFDKDFNIIFYLS
jgi:hypothetical protein